MLKRNLGSVAMSLVEIIVGILLLVNPVGFTSGIIVAFGIVLILVTGITKIQWAVDIIRMKRSKWFWMAISAAISILCGITVIANPFSTTAALWMFIGISLIVDAVFDMIGGIFGNREKCKTVADTQAEDV